jgi:hypothetical protein
MKNFEITKEQAREILIDIEEYQSYLNDLSDDTEADRMFEYGEIVQLKKTIRELKLDLPTYEKKLDKLAGKYSQELSERGLI